MPSSTLQRRFQHAPLGALILGVSINATALAAVHVANESTWGRANASLRSERVSSPATGFGTRMLLSGWTDDIKEDGYCVLVRARTTGDSWPGTEVRGTKSCGARKNFTDVPLPNGVAGLRLYREDGRYDTFWEG